MVLVSIAPCNRSVRVEGGCTTIYHNLLYATMISERTFPPSFLLLRLTLSYYWQLLLISAMMTALISCLLLSLLAVAYAGEVVVEVQSAGSGPSVTSSSRYQSHVTLYIKHADGTKTPAGWSTRQSDGADRDSPFAFQPGVGLIQGWTEGVLKMKEGERSWLHVPSEKGYGAQPMGSPNGGGFYIPANSDLVFDIEILGKEGQQDL